MYLGLLEMSEIAMINIDLLRETPVTVRITDKKDPSFIELIQSIKARGILNPLMIVKRDNHFMIVDGHRRYEAALHLKIETIPCCIADINDKQILEAQIIASSHHVPTSKVQYQAALRKIILYNPEMTFPELKSRLNKSEEWLVDMLGMTEKFDTNMLKKVISGEITLRNAYDQTN